jgi:hypothetical protein
VRGTLHLILQETEHIIQDSTIDFEKRRNVPVRYDRELMQTTVKAMKRIAEIKARREHAFWKHRFVILLHLARCLLNLWLHLQHGRCSGKDSCTPEKDRAPEIICHPCSAFGEGEDGACAGEDEDSGQVSLCVGTWRGSCDGDGHRLIYTTTVLFFCSGHSVIVDVLVSYTLCYVHVQDVLPKLCSMSSTLLVLRFRLLPCVRLECVVDAQQRLADRLRGSYHRLEDSDRDSAHHRPYGPLGRSEQMLAVSESTRRTSVPDRSYTSIGTAKMVCAAVFRFRFKLL